MPPCLTLMAFREPLKSMLCEETSVHTGLSWARIVFTFCRFWISHTWQGGRTGCLRCQPSCHEPRPHWHSVPGAPRHWRGLALPQAPLTMMVQSAEPL